MTRTHMNTSALRRAIMLFAIAAAIASAGTGCSKKSTSTTTTTSGGAPAPVLADKNGGALTKEDCLALGEHTAKIAGQLPDPGAPSDVEHGF